MKIIIETIPHSAQRYNTVGDWQWKQFHQLAAPSKLGHGEAQCQHCWATNREIAATEHLFGSECPQAPPTLVIQVSDTGRWQHAALVAIHELVEALACKTTWVSEELVDSFDKSWKPHDGLTEPGDDVQSPYYHPHQQASGIERMVAGILGEPWPAYERAMNQLWEFRDVAENPPELVSMVVTAEESSDPDVLVLTPIEPPVASPAPEGEVKFDDDIPF